MKTKKTALQTKWDLSFFYESVDDPRINKDVEAFGAACHAFESKHSSTTSWLSNETEFAAALADYEKLIETLGSSKPGAYLGFLDATDSGNAKAAAKMNLVRDRLSKEANRIIFFELRIGKIPKADQERFLASEKLAHYRYFLEKIFENSRHDLSEAEERIMTLKSLPCHALWEEGRERALQKLTVKHRGKMITISEAGSLIPNLPYKERHALYKAVTAEMLKIGDFAESEYNAICVNKKINDELRGYEKPYSSTFLRNQNTEKEVLTLIETVEKNYSVPARFYALKKKLLKLPKLAAIDRGASIGKNQKKVSFEKGFELLSGILSTLSPKYRELLETMARGGQVDVYPRKGKRGGAFCSSHTGMPTYILLNWIDNLDWVFTYAHETGHAVHSMFSEKNQSALYQDYTLSTAEVASTLFEQLVFDALYETLSDKEKIVALHDKIVDAIGSVFVQAAAFRFELEVHERIRAEGYLSKEAIADIYVKHMGAMSGKDVKFSREDGYMFIRWTHLRDFFYNYPYAYGRLISGGLYSKWKKDKNYQSKIEDFMKAGGSMSPQDIFKSIGIDTGSEAFWQEGIGAIEKDIEKLEGLLSKKR